MKQEKNDLLNALLPLLIIPLIWYLLFGRSFGDLIPGNDSSVYLLFLQELSKRGGDYQQMLLQLNILGGVNYAGSSGVNHLVSWLAYLGFSAKTMVNFSIFFIQWALAFVGLKTIEELARTLATVKRGESFKEILSSKIIFILLIAFMPVLAWRLSYGHFLLLMGILPFATVFSLVVATGTHRLSFTHALLSLFIITNSIPIVGQQLLVYSALLAVPVYLFFLIAFTKGHHFHYQKLLVMLLPIILIVASAFCLAFPRYYEMLAYVFDGNLARNLSGDPITYSYTSLSWRDLFASLFFKLEIIPTAREFFLWHETNYPFGPYIPLLFLWPLLWLKRLGLLLIFIFSMLIIFTANISPLSDVLLTLIPPLQSFRVPARAFIPFTYLLAILAFTGAMIQHYQRVPPIPASIGKKDFILLPILGSYFLPTLMQEVFLWIIVLSFFYLPHWPRLNMKWMPLLSPKYKMLIIAILSLSFFNERLLPSHDTDPVLAKHQELANSLLKNRPDLNSPFNRSIFKFEIAGLGNNKALAFNLSSLEGYYQAPARFLKLYYALAHQNYNATAVNLFIDPNTPAFPWMMYFYNVQNVLEVREGRLTLGLTANKWGPAWFSSAWMPFRGFDKLSLWAQNTDVTGRNLGAIAMINIDDEKVPQDLPTPQGDCNAGSWRDLHINSEQTEIKVHVQVRGDQCPFTLSLNYQSYFRASAAGKSIPVFPVYGALTGVFLPQGEYDLILQVVPYGKLAPFAWPHKVFHLGIIFLLCLLFAIPLTVRFAKKGNDTNAWS